MPKTKTVFIKTFGCVQNTADSERVKAYYLGEGFAEGEEIKKADVVVINSCIVRESAENRIYGLTNELKKANPEIKIIVTGCLVGAAIRKKVLRQLKEKFEKVEFVDIEKFTNGLGPIRDNKKAALISISNGCNNYCSYCIVPYARGKEVSKKMDAVIKEVDEAINNGFKEIFLIGQNVNSYGIDLTGKSLFPKLLSEIAQKPLTKISFVSSNPWDFSDELIEVISKYENIDRLIHLPLQSGDDEILKKMNRNYKASDYVKLVEKIRSKIKGVKISTDIIVGFPTETEKAFENTVEVCKKVDFEIAYLNKYSPRAGTVSAKLYKNDVPIDEKKRRWRVLEELINKKSTSNI